jgi:hypothetical protein
MSPWVRWRCSAPPTSRWPSAWPAAIPPRLWPPAARWWSRPTPLTPAPPSWWAVPCRRRGPVPTARRVFSLLFGAGNEIGSGAGRRPTHPGGGLHRLPGRRHCADGHRPGAAPADPGLRRDELHQSRCSCCPRRSHRAVKAIAEGFVASLNMGAGQFCTNPGLVIGVKGAELDAFVDAAGNAVKGERRPDHAHPGHPRRLPAGRRPARRSGKAREVARGPAGEGPHHACQAGLFVAEASDFLADEALQAEVFGAASLVIECADLDERSRPWPNSSRASSPPPCRWTTATSRPPAAAADARAQGGAGAGQRLAHRGRGVSRHGPRRPLPGHLGRPHHLGGQRRHPALPAPGVLPEPAAGASGCCPRRSMASDGNPLGLFFLHR